MTTYVELVDATLPHGLAPAVVPELKSITVGGATTGVGIESSSFRHGLVHETVAAFDVLVADGSVVHCSPTEHPELYPRLPELVRQPRLCDAAQRAMIPVLPYVRLAHERHDDPASFFASIAAECARPTCDYLDGVFFGARRLRADTRDLRRGPAAGHGSERLHVDAAVLAEPAGAHRGLPDDPRLSVALGHRLVLVQPQRRCTPCAGAARHGATAAVERDLSEDHARQPAVAAQGARPAAGAPRVGDPGRRHSAAERCGVPGRAARAIGITPCGCARSSRRPTSTRCFVCAPTRPTSTSASGTCCRAANPRGTTTRSWRRWSRLTAARRACTREAPTTSRRSGRCTTATPTRRSRPATTHRPAAGALREGGCPGLTAGHFHGRRRTERHIRTGAQGRSAAWSMRTSSGSQSRAVLWRAPRPESGRVAHRPGALYGCAPTGPGLSQYKKWCGRWESCALGATALNPKHSLLQTLE